MQNAYAKLLQISILSLSFTFLSAISTLDYTRKAEPLPNMPEGNPDLSLGIVVHENSTGIDVLRDSSQNIRFSATKNYEQTHIATLSSSSMIDRTPKKFKFIDKNHGFSSESIYEFSINFNDKNNQWEYIRFMPFPSVIEWVTKDKLLEYLEKWVKTFEDAGWQRVEHAKSDNPLHIQNFMLPTPEYNNYHQYCSWTTKDYHAVIRVKLRAPFNYEYYIPKEQRNKLKTPPDGYMVFIHISKKSQYPDFYKDEINNKVTHEAK
jgi:hypothetical protein